MRAHLKLLALALCAAFMSDPSARAQRQMESLSRGLVAMRLAEGGVFVSWRLLGTDPASQAFNLYRSASGGAPVRVNPEPIADPTCLIDREAPPDQPVEYSIRSVLEGRESKPTKPVRAWDRTYLEIPIQPLPDYRPGDASVADLDGDGDYEIVLHQVSRPRDNAFAGITGTPVLDAYELDGTRLWRIDLGINIREGEHYTQFMVYDLDGDGRAELACKTADGTRDGAGTVLGDPAKDWRNRQETSRKYGRILEGPEHFTIFDGRTGAALKTADYIAGRDPIDGWGGIGGNGGSDDYGNRCDRFLACIAYLDGQRPSAVMCRGVYGRTVIAAWDWRNGTLSNRWIFDSGISRPPFANASPFSGMGGHSLAVADVDGDGKDEIIYHAMTVDDDGRGLYSTGRRHGDTMHLGDFDPDRPGLELFLITENEDDTVRFQTPGAGLHDARTGQPIWTHSPGIDVAAAMVADIDPRHRGCEAWDGPGGLRDAGGRIIGPAPRSTGWAIWWDGDLLRELLSGNTITKWNWNQGIEERLFRAEGWSRSRAPTLAADLLGDWREEVIFPSPDGRSLRLYSTTVLTRHRLPTLMHDPQYRLAVAAQNVVYNKTPQPGFYLGEGMAPSPGPSARLR